MCQIFDDRDDAMMGVEPDIEAREQLPAISMQDRLPQKAGRRIITVDAGIMHGLAAKALKAGDGGLAAVGIASLRHGEGTTTMAGSLAACLAKSFRKRVILVEANLRSPCLRALYGLSDGPGLSEVLAGQVDLRNALRAPMGAGALLVLPASTSPLGDPAALPGAALRKLMGELFGYADTVVFDLAPILPYPDTPPLCSALDGVGLVLRAGRSTRSDGQRGVRILRDEGVPVLGAVLNGERAFIPRLIERLL